jgi:hypothetical protein
MASQESHRSWSVAAPGESARWSLTRTAFYAALIIAGIEILLLFTGNDGVRHGILFDPDCYMHLQRALRLMSGGWKLDSFDPRLNAPFGYAIHWTVLFDGLLAAGAWPLTWLGIDIRDALYIWGSAISPVLLMLALAVFAAGVRPWINGLSFLWLTLLLFTQPILASVFLAGRPDHHSLVMGLLLVQLAWLYAALDGRTDRRPFAIAIAAGLAAGVQLCTTIEALVSILLVSLVLGIAWAFYRRDVLRLLAAYWAGCLALTLIWTVATRFSIFLDAAYDRVSIVHVALLGIGTAAIALTGFLARRLPRPVALGLGGASAGAAMALLYPDFFLGPWPHLDPAVRDLHRQIGELRPLLPDSWFHLGLFLGEFAAALMALPLMIHRLRHGAMGEKMAMLTSLCGFCLFGILSLAQARWSSELQAVVLLPWALTTQTIMKSEWAVSWGERRVPLRSLVLVTALSLQLAPEALASTGPNRTPVLQANCNGAEAARALAGLQPQPRIVMTSVWAGPEILWRTGLSVVGAPYEIPPALADTAIFEKGGVAQARDMLGRRHIDTVLNCGDLKNARALGLQPAAFGTSNFRLYRVMP